MLAGMVYTGKLRWAHTVVLVLGAAGGLVFFPAAALADGDSVWPKLFLTAMGLYGSCGSLLLFGLQRYRRRKALTSAMRGDAAAYAVAWAAVTANPTQKQHLRDIEEMLEQQPPSQHMVRGNNMVRKKLRKRATTVCGTTCTWPHGGQASTPNLKNGTCSPTTPAVAQETFSSRCGPVVPSWPWTLR